MKRYKHKSPKDASFNHGSRHKKHKAQEWKQEHEAGGFRCAHCRQFVVINDIMGTANRNHCNICLWSKHVDVSKGDRHATCHGGMQPVGLSFKHEGMNRIGELMLIHLCSLCAKVSINRLARDDFDDKVLQIFADSCAMDAALRERITSGDIYILDKSDEAKLRVQLFGM